MGHLSLVSIIVPMFNAEEFISKTLASLLCERDIPIEVIVVNDQSTDSSLNLVTKIDDQRIRVVEGPGRGAAGAMNAGLAAACGSVIMCCDSDDVYPNGRVSRQVKWLQNHPEYDGICGKFSTIDDKGKWLTDMQCGDIEADITDELLTGKLRTSFCTYAIRSSLVSRVGEFREFFKAGYDLDFQFRLGEVGRIAYVPENYYFYRIHDSSITHTQPNLLREFFERTAVQFQHQRQTIGSDDLQKGCPPSIPDFGQTAPKHSARDHVQEHLLGRAWREHQAGRRVRSIRTGIWAWAVNPLNLSIWRSVIALMVKRSR